MNREEILSKVKREQLDERETAIITNALGISTISVAIICVLFLIIRIVRGDGIISDLIVITAAQIFAYEYYHYHIDKSKIRLITSIISLTIAIAFIYMYLFNIMWV